MAGLVSDLGCTAGKLLLLLALDVKLVLLLRARVAGLGGGFPERWRGILI